MASGGVSPSVNCLSVCLCDVARFWICNVFLVGQKAYAFRRTYHFGENTDFPTSWTNRLMWVPKTTIFFFFCFGSSAVIDEPCYWSVVDAKSKSFMQRRFNSKDLCDLMFKVKCRWMGNWNAAGCRRHRNVHVHEIAKFVWWSCLMVVQTTSWFGWHANKPKALNYTFNQKEIMFSLKIYHFHQFNTDMYNEKLLNFVYSRGKSFLYRQSTVQR